MERREMAEREVLANLLLVPSSFEELPEGFNSKVFVIPEYRKLFESLNNERKKPNGLLDIKACLECLPDQRNVIEDVTFAAIPLNGKLRGKALNLMNHRYPVIEEDIERKSTISKVYESKNEFSFELFSGLDIAMMEIPKESFLIKNLISDISVNFLMGEEGCGKSLLAMNLALSIAVGAKQWLSYDIEKHGKVLFLNNELSFPDFGRRLQKMVDRLPALGDISNMIIPKEVPALDNCWETLNETCQQEKPCLIVVDCLYFTYDNKNENDSSQMKALMRQFMTLRDKYGLAILIVHHTKKGSQYQRMHNDQMRGSNVFGGSADTTLQIRRSSSDEGKRIIKPLKGRHISDDMRKCRLLSLDPENLWFKDEGETEEGEHIVMETQTALESIDFKSIFGDAKELSRKKIIERCRPMGYDERTIDRLLKQAKEKGILKVPKYGFYALRHFDIPIQKDVNVKVR